jgi:hypothetical protein
MGIELKRRRDGGMAETFPRNLGMDGCRQELGEAVSRGFKATPQENFLRGVLPPEQIQGAAVAPT